MCRSASGACILALLLVLPACSCRPGERPPPEVAGAEPTAPPGALTPSPFRAVDPLVLQGRTEEAESALLAMLQDTSPPRGPVLLRLLGIYHGRAAEDDFLLLLDSLETALGEDLSGWRVSALDLARRPLEALPHAEGALQRAWLLHRGDSTPPEGLRLPPPRGAAETCIRARLQPSGSLAPAQMRELLRCLGEVDLAEGDPARHLVASADTAGAWWDSLVAELPEEMVSGGVAEARALRDAASGSRSLSEWEETLLGGGGASAVAALRLAGTLRPDWTLFDALVEDGHAEEALALAVESGAMSDPVFEAGAQMSLLLSEGETSALSALCSGLGPGSPDSLRARAALYGALALQAGGAGARAWRGAMLDFALEHPWHPLARQSAYGAGVYHDCEQEWAEAADAYMASLRSAGSWEGDERAHWRGGFSLYMSGDRERADSLWVEGCTMWPSGYWRDEMLFWLARLRDGRGDGASADSLLELVAVEHPWEFYGMLAASRLGGTSPEPVPYHMAATGGDSLTGLTSRLMAAGWGVPSVRMLTRSPSESAAALLSACGRHGDALRMMRAMDVRLREMGSLLPESLLGHYFPSPYAGLARSATDTLGLSPAVLQGIMREESYFDRWVVSRAGAMGVVQLMPGTAADVARWYGLTPLSGDDFFSPGLSVPYGALYIDRQSSGFGGDLPLFLAAYNAGPGNAERWRGMHGWNRADPELYIEQITYRETRMYVKKVLRSAWLYGEPLP